MSLKESLFALAEKTPLFEKVEIPELGEPAFVYAITAADRGMAEKIGSEMRKADESRYWKNFKALCVSASLCDESGKPITFNSANGDVDKLALLPAAAIERLFDVSNRLNGWAGSTEDRAKNS